jgi:hypothetical protein
MEEKESQTSTWSQDLYLMSKREKQSLFHAYTKARTCSNQAASISALLDCAYLLDQGFSSEGHKRRYVKAKKKSVAKTAVPACVPSSPEFSSKGK